ncbi:unnamed protein product [Adineta steineri]|uniref:Uncharacterized protein n=1 Tax=Adineta steineri TaxID=433720 RepID=A0A814KFK6_9BILA|nr:unnamed protein product [Adineta steineri]CAF4007554.1 unnamed protein product [Adineta steineri]
MGRRSLKRNLNELIKLMKEDKNNVNNSIKDYLESGQKILNDLPLLIDNRDKILDPQISLDTQILALWLFLNSDLNQTNTECLAQISTGEGKLTIVAALAAIKNMSLLDEPTEEILKIDFTNQNADLPSFPHPFLSGNYGDGKIPKSLIELRMMNLSGNIRNKSKWFEKMQDQIIRNKWKQEALEQSSLSEKQIDYVLAELEYYNSIRDQSMEMSVVDGVWQSDELIPQDIKQSLISCVQSLENIPENEQDWHPGTNKQVLDLVHPSLFCFVNQTTRVINERNHLINLDDALKYIGLGQTIDINANTSLSNSQNKQQKLQKSYSQSNTYQWIPTEFNVSKDGRVKIESYINNLHPIQHKQLYQVIENICQHFIPLFSKVLTDLIDNQNKPNRIIVDPYKWYENESSSSSSNEDHEDDNDDDNHHHHRTIIQPDVGEFHMPSLTNSNIDLRGRKLQIIVKLANIILTPTNPAYPGGVWHIEGMENEHIIATGIYYYFNSNITQSNLQFRTAICEPNYEQDDRYGVDTIYGLQDELPLNQLLGEVITQENRCLVFPNLYQHRVAPFQLKDPTQPGQRKILVFFLVDPTIRILSTAHIPPQQSHWYCDIIRSIPVFNELPSLVVDKIMSYIDFPMTMDQAKQHREELMNERKYFISQNNELLFERPFSLCEH